MLARFGIALEHDRPIVAIHRSNFRRTNAIRPRRAYPLIIKVLCIASLVSSVVWAAHSRQQATATITVAVHTITSDCVSAERMARHYGWTGDWRAFSYETEQLNGWDRWPLLHLGEQILVPDYRNHQSRHQQLDVGFPARRAERRGGPDIDLRCGLASRSLTGTARPQLEG